MLLGPDLKEELPVLYLRLRDAAERRAVRIVELSAPRQRAHAVRLAVAAPRPGEQASLLRALVGSGPASGLGIDDAEIEAVRDNSARERWWSSSDAPTSRESAAFTVDAAAALLAAHPAATFLPPCAAATSVGALDMGLSPGMLPGRAGWPTPAATSGRLAAAAAGAGSRCRRHPQAAAAGRIGCLILLGVDPLADFPDRDLARRAWPACTVIAVDTFLTESSRQADVVLAVGRVR